MRPALAPIRGRSRPGGGLRLAAILLTLIPAVSQPIDSLPDRAGLRLPPDIVLKDRPDSPAPVVFRHAIHVELREYRCLGCHPRPFSILGRHDPISHEIMSEGRSCGLCHNGRDATGIDDADACEVCHSGEASR